MTLCLYSFLELVQQENQGYLNLLFFAQRSTLLHQQKKTLGWVDLLAETATFYFCMMYHLGLS